MLPDDCFTAIDMSYGSVYCHRCKDHIYDDELDKIVEVRNSTFFGKQQLSCMAFVHVAYCVINLMFNHYIPHCKLFYVFVN